jgi:quercetin dioxygenase-like cupin family protein
MSLMRGLDGEEDRFRMHDTSRSPKEKTPAQPRPKVAKLDPAAVDYVPILGGPPETATMRSGAVVLLPGQSVGKHSTGDYEEAIVVLAGSGELRLSDGSTYELAGHSVAYCPPATEHDVANTGAEPLRYVYIVAKAR